MVAQLRYQDPMNPADSSQFLSQNAQFTALEKMQDVADQTAALLNSQVAFGSAGLVGKSVTWLDDQGNTVPGTVDGVTFGASGPVLDVDGASVTLAQIQSIGTSASAPASSGSTTA
jgi:flagellar basal-body rod modification protein FlgD